MPTLGYPLDLTGAAPTNLVVNETHTFTTPDTRVFVPSGGPFYSSTVILRHGITNAVLLPNTDYKLLHLHRDGTIASGKQVCAVVYIHNLNIPSVVMQYQIIGSTYADTADSIRDLLSGTHPIPPSIAWGHVFGAPVQFAPAEHLHHADEVYGMQEVVSALEQMRVAILSGDSFAFDAIYQYISNLFTSQDWATQQQLTVAIASATVNPYGSVRSYRTFAELRAETQFTNDASTIYVAAGRGNALDGQGRSFVWAKNSTAVDNDETVLRPDIIAVGANGRLQSAMRIEFDVRNLAQTLGRRIGTTGAIESDLSTVSPLGSTSLNTLVTPGVYWVSSAVTNRPADVDSGVIVVERSHINNVIQTLYVHTSNVAPPDDDTSRTNVVIQHRSGSRNVETDAMDWTTWESTFSRTRAIVNGIDTELALTRSTSIDINTIARSSSYWVLSTAPNTPFMTEDCVLNVHCIDATRTMQHAITVGYEAWRMGHSGIDYVGHTWTGWTYRATQGGDSSKTFKVASPVDDYDAVNLLKLTEVSDNLTEQIIRRIDCALGVTPQYIGGTSVLLPTIIGSRLGLSTSTIVNIDGVLTPISIIDIEPLYAPAYSVQFGSIFLDYNYDGLGANRLAFVTHDSASVGYTGQSYTSNRQPNKVHGMLFLGVAWIVDNQWEVVRNWFQDPGLIEHKGFYDVERSDLNTLPKVTGPIALTNYVDTCYIDNSNLIFYSPANNLPIAPVTFIAWAGEVVRVSLEGDFAADIPVVQYTGGEITLLVYANDDVSGLDTLVSTTSMALTSHGLANEKSQGYWKHAILNADFVAPRTAAYTVSILGTVIHSDAKIYMRGKGADSKSRSRLQVTLSQCMAYNDFIMERVLV